MLAFFHLGDGRRLFFAEEGREFISTSTEFSLIRKPCHQVAKILIGIGTNVFFSTSPPLPSYFVLNSSFILCIILSLVTDNLKCCIWSIFSKTLFKFNATIFFLIYFRSYCRIRSMHRNFDTDTDVGKPPTPYTHHILCTKLPPPTGLFSD